MYQRDRRDHQLERGHRIRNRHRTGTPGTPGMDEDEDDSSQSQFQSMLQSAITGAMSSAISMFSSGRLSNDQVRGTGVRRSEIAAGTSSLHSGHMMLGSGGVNRSYTSSYDTSPPRYAKPTIAIGITDV